MPRVAPFTQSRVAACDNAEDWGDGEATLPSSVTVHIGRHFSGDGHASTLRRMYDRATLFTLLGNLALALLALLMFCGAAVLVIYAPADRRALIPWMTVPPTIVSLALGGFAAFRLSVTGAGVSLRSASDAPAGRGMSTEVAVRPAALHGEGMRQA